MGFEVKKECGFMVVLNLCSIKKEDFFCCIMKNIWYFCE